jgi:hypothetical protein
MQTIVSQMTNDLAEPPNQPVTFRCNRCHKVLYMSFLTKRETMNLPSVGASVAVSIRVDRDLLLKAFQDHWLKEGCR